MHTRKFDFSGRSFEAKATATEKGWEIQVYENGKPATDVIYSVSHVTNIDARMQKIPVDLVNSLLELAQHDIEHNRVNLI